MEKSFHGMLTSGKSVKWLISTAQHIQFCQVPILTIVNTQQLIRCPTEKQGAGHGENECLG